MPWTKLFDVPVYSMTLHRLVATTFAVFFLSWSLTTRPSWTLLVPSKPHSFYNIACNSKNRSHFPNTLHVAWWNSTRTCFLKLYGFHSLTIRVAGVGQLQLSHRMGLGLPELWGCRSVARFSQCSVAWFASRVSNIRQYCKCRFPSTQLYCYYLL